MHTTEIKLKPEFENDLWLTAHKLNECYIACYEKCDCTLCPFYDVFETDCRSKVHCRNYLVNNAVNIHRRQIRQYCEAYPERPVIPESVYWDPCPDECEYLQTGTCAFEVDAPCPYGLYRGE